MSSPVQTVLALTIVALAAGALVWRAIRSRRHPGGGCSGCPTDTFKERLRK